MDEIGMRPSSGFFENARNCQKFWTIRSFHLVGESLASMMVAPRTHSVQTSGSNTAQEVTIGGKTDQTGSF